MALHAAPFAVAASAYAIYGPATFLYRDVYPTDGPTSMKDVGLRIRVQRDLRDSFLAACRAQDKPAAQVLREFMHAYVAQTERENEHGSQLVQPSEGSKVKCR